MRDLPNEHATDQGSRGVATAAMASVRPALSAAHRWAKGEAMRLRSEAARRAGRALGIVLLATVTAGCWHDRADSAEELGFAAGEERTIEGVVVENTVDVCWFPEEHRQPCIPGSATSLRVDVDGVEVWVMYHRGGGYECENAAAIRQGSQARVGTRVEVFALVEGSDRLHLDTCPSPDYHIAELD